MLTRWLTFTAFLVGSADPERAVTGNLTIAPTCRVKGHPEVELTLNCGHGKNAGVVQYWHTPFGDLQTPGFYSKLDPIFMHRDGSLAVPNTSILHSGMYYCLMQHTEGSTLWTYELHVGPDSPNKQRDAFRFRRDVGSVEERQAGVSDEQFAGAVAASVLLTFVVGFSAGALTRTHVLRCYGAVTSSLRSPRQRCHGSGVTMTTLPPLYDNQAFEMERALDDDDSANCATMETTSSSSTTSPPAKPQRSFRKKQQEEQETTAYLEGCDYMKEEEEAGRSLEEDSKGWDGEEEREFSGFYLVGEDGGSPTETDEDKSSEDGEEKDARESREEKKEQRQEVEAGEQENRSMETGSEEVEATGQQQNRSMETGSEEVEATGEQENRSMETGSEEVEEAGEQENRNKERGSEEEKGRDEKREEEDGETDISSEDETGRNKEEDTMKNGVIDGGGGETSPSSGRRSRVIRLYQYDENGQRYGHLPDPAPHEAGPAPRLKQRSLSLTRLNAIMAAASAGPLDERQREGGERRGSTSTWRFHI